MSYGYPAVIALSVKKMKYATMKGTFTQKKLSKFVIGLMTGRESLATLRVVPKPTKATEWDGKDKQPAVTISQLDLSYHFRLMMTMMILRMRRRTSRRKTFDDFPKPNKISCIIIIAVCS